jgi:exopolysaccharide production protein ExoQ
MAPVALIVCLAFISWLVVRDVRRRPSVSAAIWIPTLLVMMLGSRPVSLWLSGGPIFVASAGNDADRSSLDQIFYLLVITSSVIICSSRHVKWSKLFASNKALAVLYLFFAISILWSGDPGGSMKRWIKDISTICVISVILTEKDPFDAIGAVYVRCASVLFPLSVVFIKYYPAWGRAYAIAGVPMFTGVTTQKNTLGEMVLVFSLFLVWDSLEMRTIRGKRPRRSLSWDKVVLLAMGFWLLNISQSKTALLCLLISLALTLRTRRFASKPISTVVLLCTMSVPFLMFFAQQFSAVLEPLVAAVGRNMTFTGRKDIWDHITSTTVNPLIGAGFWNFWGGPGGRAISEEMNTGVPNAHCGYVDIYLDGGVTGLILLFYFILTSGRRLIKTTNVNRFHLLRFAFLMAMILYNLSESTFLRQTTSWFTTLLVTLAFPFPKADDKGRRSVSPPAECFSTTLVGQG